MTSNLLATLMINRNHLKEVNQTYADHLVFSVRLSVHLLLLSVVSMIHALLPFVMTETVSKHIKELDGVLSK